MNVAKRWCWIRKRGMREGEGDGKEKGGGGNGDCFLWRNHLYTKTRTEYSPLSFRMLEAWIVTWSYHSCLTRSHDCPGHPHQKMFLMEDTTDKIHRKVHLISSWKSLIHSFEKCSVSLWIYQEYLFPYIKLLLLNLLMPLARRAEFKITLTEQTTTLSG